MSDLFDGWDRTPEGFRRLTFPTGEVVEVAVSSSGAPPGFRGMATCCSTVWVRLNGGDWIRSRERSHMDTLRAARDLKWVRDLAGNRSQES